MKLPVVSLGVGVVVEQRAEVDVGRSLRGGQRAHADIHLTIAEGEDPAVPGKDAIVLTAELEVPLDKLLTEDRCPQLRTSYRVDPWTADVVVGEGGTRAAAKDLLGGQRAACLALKPSNLAATVTSTVPVGAGYLLVVMANGALWMLVIWVISQTAWRFFETMGSDPRTLFDHADDQLRRLGTIRSWSLAGLALWATSLLFSPLDFDGRMFVALPVLALGALGTLPAKHVFRRAAQLQLDEEATV